MHTQIHPQHSFAVQSLLEYLEKEYYIPAALACDKLLPAPGSAAEVRPAEDTYLLNVWSTLVAQVQRYIRVRRLSLLPYLHELAEKEDTGHDCRACTSTCTIRHAAQLNDIREAHRGIKESLQVLKTATAAPEHFSAEMQREGDSLRDLLSEMIYLEETALIPKISAAQKAIYAHP